MTDPAASYRSRTERQRASNERRHNKESADILSHATKQRTAAAKAAHLLRQRKILAAAEYILCRGMLKGDSLSPGQRTTIEAIAADARKAIARLVAR